MKGFMGRSSKLTAAAALLAAVAMIATLPAAAFGQAGDPNADPTAAQYESPTEREERPTDANDPTSGQETETVALSSSGTGSSGTLPFTGFDAAVVAAVALLLGATGLALRRFSAVR